MIDKIGSGLSEDTAGTKRTKTTMSKVSGEKGKGKNKGQNQGHKHGD